MYRSDECQCLPIWTLPLGKLLDKYDKSTLYLCTNVGYCKTQHFKCIDCFFLYINCLPELGKLSQWNHKLLLLFRNKLCSLQIEIEWCSLLFRIKRCSPCWDHRFFFPLFLVSSRSRLSRSNSGNSNSLENEKKRIYFQVKNYWVFKNPHELG